MVCRHPGVSSLHTPLGLIKRALYGGCIHITLQSIETGPRSDWNVYRTYTGSVKAFHARISITIATKAIVAMTKVLTARLWEATAAHM